MEREEETGREIPAVGGAGQSKEEMATSFFQAFDRVMAEWVRKKLEEALPGQDREEEEDQEEEENLGSGSPRTEDEELKTGMVTLQLLSYNYRLGLGLADSRIRQNCIA